MRTTLALLFAATIAAQAPLHIASQRPTDLMFCVLSPDAQDVAFLDGAYGISMLNLASGRTKQIAKPRPGIMDRTLTFSRDGKSIYYLFPDTAKSWIRILYRVSLADGEPRKILFNVNSTPAFSPDGKSMAFVRADESLVIADAEGLSQRTITTLPQPPSRVFWSADGRAVRVAFNVFSRGFFSGKWKLLRIAVDSGKSEEVASWDGGWGSIVLPAEGDGLFLFKPETHGARTPTGQIAHYQPSTKVWTTVSNELPGFMNLIGVSSDRSTIAAWRESSGFWEGLLNVVGIPTPQPSYEIVLLSK